MGIGDRGGAAKNKSKISVKKVHDVDSIIAMMKYIALADEQRNQQEATDTEEKEKANMTSMGIRRLQQLVQKSTEGYVLEETGGKREMAATPDSESSAERSKYR